MIQVGPVVELVQVHNMSSQFKHAWSEASIRHGPKCWEIPLVARRHSDDSHMKLS